MAIEHGVPVFTSTDSEPSNTPEDATGWRLCLANLPARLNGAPTFERHAGLLRLSRSCIEALGVDDLPGVLRGQGCARRRRPASQAVGRSVGAADDTRFIVGAPG